MSDKALEDEIEFQSYVLQAAIKAAVMKASTDFEKPSINAVLGALISCTGEAYAKIANEQARNNTIKHGNKLLKAHVAALVESGLVEPAKFITRGKLDS